MEYLALDSPPLYLESSFRSLAPGEAHINRIANFDVLILMFDGMLRFREAGRPVELAAGEWYIQRAGLEQEGHMASEEPRYFYVHFRGTMGEGGRHALPLAGQFQPDVLRPLTRHLEHADRSLLSKTEQSRWFYEILCQLQREVGFRSERLQPVCRYLAAQYPQPVCLRSLATRFGYSEDHLIRLFRRELGLTPHQYLTRIRLRSAQRMLLDTDLTLQNIAAACGYADVSALYRIFVRYTGVSPSAWRQKRITGLQ